MFVEMKDVTQECKVVEKLNNAHEQTESKPKDRSLQKRMLSLRAVTRDVGWSRTGSWRGDGVGPGAIERPVTNACNRLQPSLVNRRINENMKKLTSIFTNQST